ncbi:MAG: site-2 protease family protein [Nitriliruptor sp.]|uniref:site-2 protease family protein n=1 Tax=Nitriliruptor sp. TaxID=2448056 RepID=UPI0034A005DA
MNRAIRAIRAIRVARFQGVEVRLDPSLALLAVVLAWLLFTRFSPTHGTGVAAAMAAVASLLFFASILAHELAHALEALHRDIHVGSITLLLFGGVTEMHRGPEHPRDEFVVAAVGPYASLVCAAVFGLVSAGAAAFLTGPAGAAVLEVSRLLAYLNLLLAVFNLVPGAPLDGGRVLRAAIWYVTGDRHRAVRSAARAGQLFAVVTFGFGILELTRGLAVAAIGGIWWVVIGVFLFGAARAELRRADLLALYAGRTVADMLGPGPLVVDPDRPLDTLEFGPGSDDHLLVAGGTDGDDPITGWLDAATVRDLHPTDRTLRTAGDLAEDVGALPIVTADTPLEQLVQRFLGSEEDHLRIVDEGRTIAVLSERRTARALRELGAGDAGPRRVPATSDAVGRGS